jgi:hypothetical protein
MFGKPQNDKISLAVAVFYKFLSASLIVTDLRKHMQFYHACHVVSEQNAVGKDENDLCVPTKNSFIYHIYHVLPNDMQTARKGSLFI